MVHPNGKKHFSYHLSSGDIHIWFSNASTPKGDTPNVWLEIGSMPCWSPGAPVVLAKIKKCLKKSGVLNTIVKISRVDITADFVGLSFEDSQVVNQRRWIKQARKYGIFGDGDRHNYMCIGAGGSISLKIYDKSFELKRNLAKKSFFYELWGLDLDSEEQITRVEFQLRRKALKEFKINLFEDLEKSLDSLWQYLTDNWFRISKHDLNKDNHDYSNTEVSELWFHVQSLEWKIPESVAVCRLPVPKRKDDNLLLCQIVGLSMSLGVLDKKVDSFDQLAENFINRSIEKLRELYCNNNDDYWLRLRSKWNDCWGNTELNFITGEVPV